MLAIDTNILVRDLTRDHPVQSARAKQLVGGHDVYVTTTVVLESEWVLRSVYGYAPPELRGALRSFAGLKTVSVKDPVCLARALQHAEAGMDFADALHVERSGRCDAFVTLDRRLVRSARRCRLHHVKSLSVRGEIA